MIGDRAVITDAPAIHLANSLAAVVSLIEYLDREGAIDYERINVPNDCKVYSVVIPTYEPVPTYSKTDDIMLDRYRFYFGISWQDIYIGISHEARKVIWR